MSAQTFDEWWATHYNTNERDKIMCREAWHSRDAEVAELRATNLRLIRGDFNQICSHCAWEAAAPATWEQLQAHIQECPSHPIATLKREVAELQVKLTEANLLVERYDDL